MSHAQSSSSLEELEQLLGYTFQHKSYLVAAITHPSATENQPIKSYQRLEFLGDSILGAIVARELFIRFPNLDEGKLTHLKIAVVSGETLSKVAKILHFDEYIIFGKSEKGTHIRGLQHALEDVYEAVVAALFLDGGLQVAYDFILKTLGDYIKEELADVPVNPKSKLQEVLQRQSVEQPKYRLISEEGPGHSPIFTCAVVVHGKDAGIGTGSTKKAAESNAAMEALKNLGYIPRSISHE